MLSPEKIVVIDGGYRKDATFEFWIVPPNAEPPKPTPTFSPQEIAVCPDISITGETFKKDRNQPLKFSADIKNQTPNAKLDLEWNVSAGKVNKGQNTNQIGVDVSETEATFISVSVTVKGINPECKNHAFISAQIGIFRYNYPVSFSYYDYSSYGYSSFKIEELNGESWYFNRVDAFINELNADPRSKGYIFIYGSRNGGKGKSAELVKTINDHLRFRDFFDKTRLIVLDGGYREEAMIEFSVVPAGAEPPKPTPTLDSQFVTQPKKAVKKQPKTKK